MQPIKPTVTHLDNQGSVIVSNQEAKGLNTGDTYNINGINVTILLVLQINSKNTEIVYYVPPDTNDDD